MAVVMTDVREICTPTNVTKVTFGVRKYAGAWIPLVVVDGKWMRYAHCSTREGAMEAAMLHAKRAAGAA